jgi:hypothetical protein
MDSALTDSEIVTYVVVLLEVPVSPYIGWKLKYFSGRNYNLLRVSV